MFRYALLDKDYDGPRWLRLLSCRAPEKLMAFRLLRYSVAAMQRHIEQGNDSLPVVIPLLFYHGTTSPYPYSTQWFDCFADPQLAESVYRQAFPLVDITTIPDSEILTTAG